MPENTPELPSVVTLVYGRTRCFLIHGKLLVDTDWAGSFPAFLQCIKEKGISLQDIQYLLITHYHPDHMGIAADLMQRGITLLVMDVQQGYVHQADAVFAGDRRNRFTPIPEKQALILKCEESRHFLEGIGIRGEIIPTPGHSADSISLILEDEGAAFVGDLPPLEQIAYYQDPVMKSSADALQKYGVKILYHSHWPEEHLES